MKIAEMDRLVKETVLKHVNPNECYVFVFGSRADERFDKASDYDIGLYSGRKIPFRILGRLEEELEESDLPVEVDVVDFSTVSLSFKALALSKVKIWNRPKSGLKLI